MIFEDCLLLTTYAISSKEDTAYQRLDFTRKHVCSRTNTMYPVEYIRFKGVTPSGGKTTTKTIRDRNIIDKEPPVLHHDKPIGPNEVLVETKPQEKKEQTVRLPTPSIPFPHRLKKEKEETQQRRVGNKDVIFDVDQSIKRPFAEDDECYWIDDLDTTKHSKTQDLLKDNQMDSFLVNNLEEYIDQSDLESYGKAVDDSEFEISIWRIKKMNTSYSESQETHGPERTQNEHLYSVGANEIDEKKTRTERPTLPLRIRIGKTQGRNRLEEARHKRNKSFILHTQDLDGGKLQTGHSTLVALNPKVQVVVKNEIVSLLDSGRMKFGLCNAPATFQRCMTTIFHDMVEDFMEVFMDDFSVLDNSFDQCLDNSDKMLARKGIKVDKAKIDVMAKPWYVDYVNYIVGKVVPPKWTPEKKQFFSQVRNYFWDEPYAFRLCPDNVMRRYVAGDEILEILAHCHSGLIGGITVLWLPGESKKDKAYQRLDFTRERVCSRSDMAYRAEYICRIQLNRDTSGSKVTSGNRYSEKGEKRSKTDKTEHENGKSVKSQSQGCVYLKWANPHPFNGPCQPIKPLSRIRTRSSSNLVGETFTNPNPKGHNRRHSKQRVKPFSLEETPVVTMADQRTMADLLRAPTEGYAEAIVVPPIPAEHFELKHNLINLVTSKQFFGFKKEDPHAHIRYFNKITSTLKYKDVPESSIKFMLFPFSIDEIASVVASAVTSAMTAMFKQHQVTSAPASVKVVEESCVTCGGAHSYRQCPATNGNTFSGYQDNIQGYVSAAAVNYNKGNTGYRPQSVANQFRPPGFAQPNVQNQGFNQNRGNNFNQGNTSYQASIQQTQVATSSDLEKFKKTNEASMQAMRNHITITTRSGVFYEGPLIPPSFSYLPKVVERVPEVTKDTVQPSTENIQPPVVQTQVLIDEPVVAPKLKPTMSYPSRMNKQKLRKNDDNLALKFLEIFRKLHFELSFADALLHMPKFSTMFKSLLNNKEKLFDLETTPVNENCSAVILKSASINLMPLSIWEKLSLPKLTLTQMILKLADQLTTRPAGIAEDVFVKVEKFHFPTDFVVVDYVVDPWVLLILGRTFLRTGRALIDVYGEELTLRVNDKAITFKLVRSISKKCSGSQKFLRVAIPLQFQTLLLLSLPHLLLLLREATLFWKIEACLANKSIPPGIDDTNFDLEGDILLIEKLLNDDPSSPLPPKELNLEELKQLVYPISDSPWVSPVHCVPKKGGMTIVTTDDDELIPTRLVTGWRVCIDYRKINDATRKDHFSLPFMDQMLERLAGNEFYCFLDGFFDYLSKWVEAKALPTNDARVVMKFLKSLFARFRTPRAIISDRGTQFCNDQFAKVMLTYGVTHRLSTAYHPQTSGQVEVSNRCLKRILKRTVGENHASWSDKLDDALWAFRIAFKTLIGCTPYKLVYEKACHLPIELEHKAYWALKHCSYDLKTTGDPQKVKLNKLHDQAYENFLIYKDKMNRMHDSKIKNRVFNVGDQVLLFNSRLNIFLGKLKTRWTGPFTVAQVFPYGTIELSSNNDSKFKVNGHRLKHYFGGDIPPMVVLDLQTFPMDN
nr:reverse transcriptase domain-containing protein [Tanacetum cinerariifolium]